MSNVIKLYNNVPVLFTEDAFFNATEVSKPWGKSPKDWLRNEATQEYVEAVGRNLLTEQNQLVKVVQGGDPLLQGTWLHPKLAIAFARWLNADFAVWCDVQIEEILASKFKPIQARTAHTQAMIDMLIRADELEHQQALLREESQRQAEIVKAIEAKQKAIEMSCRDFAVMAYANLIGVSVDLQTASKLGKRCAQISRERNMPIGKVRDPRFGQVNTYIEDILQEVFAVYADL